MTKSRTLGNLVKTGAVQFPSSLGTEGQTLQVNSGENGLEFADASGSGVTVYTDLSGTDGTPSGATYLLNASSPSAGDLAYVSATTSLYQNNGNGWYKIVTVNTSPTLSSPSTGTDITLAKDGTASTVTITAADVDEGTTLEYSYTVSTGSLTNGGGTTATVYGADGTTARAAGTNYTDNVFKVDPTTNSSHGGSFSLTFNATDTINTAQTIQNFSLSFSAPWGDRGTIAGGYNYDDHSSNVDIIDYFDITTAGNATDFGNLVVGRQEITGVSSGTYIVWNGSKADNISSTNRRKMDYITVATTGNAADFTGLYIDNKACMASASDGSRGLFFGNGNSPGTNEINYITIEIPGSDAADFGDYRSAAARNPGASGNDTYALVAGGMSNSGGVYSNQIDKLTIQTQNSATDTGDLRHARMHIAAASDSTRTVFTTGENSAHPMTWDYVTIANGGNASDFADHYSIGAYYSAGQSNGTRGVFKTGHNDNGICFITIQTTATASDFGDLNYNPMHAGGASGFDA